MQGVHELQALEGRKQSGAEMQAVRDQSQRGHGLERLVSGLRHAELPAGRRGEFVPEKQAWDAGRKSTFAGANGNAD